MTRNEALEQLESLKEHCKEMMEDDDSIWSRDVDALNVAIEVVKEVVRLEQKTQIENLKEQLSEEVSRRYQAECNEDAWKERALYWEEQRLKEEHHRPAQARPSADKLTIVILTAD